MHKLYLVYELWHDGPTAIHAVFSDIEKAQDYIDKFLDTGFIVEIKLNPEMESKCYDINA